MLVRSCGSVKPSKPAPLMGVRLFLAGFDLGYIITRYETCIELSRSSADDDVAWERETVKTGTAHWCEVIPCRFWHWIYH